MCSAKADLLSISSGRAQLLERGIKLKLYKKIWNHNKESYLTCPLGLGKELCVYLLGGMLTDIPLRTFIIEFIM